MTDPVFLSRLQFAFTLIIHIIFPILSMGLAPFLVYFTWKEVRTKKPVYEQLRRFWSRIFAISFVVGTVTGIVMEFEFGTNWAGFSRAAGSVIAGPLATEGMMAFFLEAAFLGIFLFGRDRVSDRGYFMAAFLTGLGSWLSATWILDANSWMQNPQGYQVTTQNGHKLITLTDPVAAYANPRFLWEFVHMQNSVILSVALLIAGISAYHVWTNQAGEFWRRSMKSALTVMLFSAPFQVIQGDAYARQIAHTQPEKFAAMEAVWKTARYVPEYIIAFPTQLSQIANPRAKELVGLGIPGMASWLSSGGNPNAAITGLNKFAGVGTPPVAAVFWSFRIMVALGFLFIVLAFWAGYRWWTGELFEDRLLHKALMASSLLGFVAVEFGWMVTEIGRQPWIIQGVMKTSQAVSPTLSGTDALLTFVGFVGGYAILLILSAYVIVRIIQRGPPSVPDTPPQPTGEQGATVDDD